MIHITERSGPENAPSCGTWRTLRATAPFAHPVVPRPNVARGRQMKLKRDLHLEISRKLQNSVSVKVFAFRADRDAERVCLGALHMPEPYMRVFRSILEYGSVVLGARVTVGGSYFSSGPLLSDDAMLSNPAP
jgi:hypothetical protein